MHVQARSDPLTAELARLDATPTASGDQVPKVTTQKPGNKVLARAVGSFEPWSSQEAAYSHALSAGQPHNAVGLKGQRQLAQKHPSMALLQPQATAAGMAAQALKRFDCSLVSLLSSSALQRMPC